MSEVTAVSNSQFLPILLNIAASFAGAFGQYFYKRGADTLTSVPIWKNTDLGLGCLLFCGVMLLFIAAYRMGGSMSVVYPFYASTFIWSTLIAVLLAGESVSGLQCGGILLVVLGTVLVAIGRN